jgi:hypothetical protein
MRDYRSLRACVFLESIEICLIVNFWFIFDTIRKAPACGVYISQLEQYARVCFFLSGKQWKLKKQEFILEQLKSLLRKFYSFTWLTFTECTDNHEYVPFIVILLLWNPVFNLKIYLKILKTGKTTGATNGAGTAYPSGAPEFT